MLLTLPTTGSVNVSSVPSHRDVVCVSEFTDGDDAGTGVVEEAGIQVPHIMGQLNWTCVPITILSHLP